MISVLLPTRERFNAAYKAIESLYNNARHPSKIEFLLKVDDDDEQLIQYRSLPFKANVIASPRGRGYQDMHLYVNELCQHAQGDWLFLFNDDALMLTEGWDAEVFEAEVPPISVLKPASEDVLNLFPIVSRRFYDTLGHFSMSAHNDTYVEMIAEAVGRQYNIPVQITHLRDQMNDKTGQESASAYSITSPLFYSEAVQAYLNDDIELIRDAIEKEQ